MQAKQIIVLYSFDVLYMLASSVDLMRGSVQVVLIIVLVPGDSDGLLFSVGFGTHDTGAAKLQTSRRGFQDMLHHGLFLIHCAVV